MSSQPPWATTNDPTDYYGEDSNPQDPAVSPQAMAPWSPITGYLPSAPITGEGTSQLALGAVGGVPNVVGDPITSYTIDHPNL